MKEEPTRKIVLIACPFNKERHTAVHYLTRAGHEILQAPDPELAHNIVKENDHLDLVIVDLDFEGKFTMKTVELAGQKYPDATILLLAKTAGADHAFTLSKNRKRIIDRDKLHPELTALGMV